MEKKWKNPKVNGNLTIECAMIMPLILLVIISVVWLMIYLYDSVVIEKALVHGVMAADYRDSRTNSELMKEIEMRIDEGLDGLIVGCDETKVSVKVSKYKVFAQVETHMNIPLNVPGLSELSTLNAEINKRRMYGADLIFDTKRVETIARLIEYLNEQNSDKGQ